LTVPNGRATPPWTASRGMCRPTCSPVPS
jgi:hypothetical protein